MKTFYRILAAALVLLMAACNGAETVDTPVFSFEKPSGYSLDKENVSIPDYCQATLMSNGGNAISIMAFPEVPDVEKFLYSQTYGGFNAELKDCRFDGITSATVGSVETKKVGVDGTISGRKVKGTIYAFKEGGYLFMVMGFGTKAAPDETESLIPTIQAKADPRGTDGKLSAQLAAIIKVSKSTLPRPMDEVSTWKDVTVDEARKCIVMDVEISGNSDALDLEYFRNFIDELRDESIVPVFREQRSADLLIEIPGRMGYDFEYVYTTAGDGKEIGRMHIDNASIMD